MLETSEIDEKADECKFYKRVAGSFHQGDIRFGASAGRQCCGIALYSVCFSVVADVTVWCKEIIDSIVLNGDRFYKSLGKDRYLDVDDLPKNLNINNKLINIRYNFNTYGTLKNSDIEKDYLFSWNI